MISIPRIVLYTITKKLPRKTVVITVLSPKPITTNRTGTQAIVGTDTSKFITGSNILFNVVFKESKAPTIVPLIDAMEKPINNLAKLEKKCFHNKPSTKANSKKRLRISVGYERVTVDIKFNLAATSQTNPITRKGNIV
jgi:hypothetical protein